MKKILMDSFAEKAKELGYSVQKYKSDRRVYQISKNNKNFLTISKHLPLNSVVAYKIVKRKDLTKNILLKAGIPVPKGILTSKWHDVLESLNKKELKFPLVTKPDTSSLGKYVAAKINSVHELKETFNRVLKRFGKVLVEEYCEGEDYRFLVLDGRVVAVAHRILPFVVGDGKSTISQLIEKYNEGKLEPLMLGYEVDRVLKKQSLEMSSVPQNNQKVILRSNANAHTGGGVENVTDEVDSKFKEISVKATEALGLRFCGVDIIAVDIKNPDSSYKIVELNADPGYDLHWENKVGDIYDATGDILHSLLD